MAPDIVVVRNDSEEAPLRALIDNVLLCRVALSLLPVEVVPRVGDNLFKHTRRSQAWLAGFVEPIECFRWSQGKDFLDSSFVLIREPVRVLASEAFNPVAEAVIRAVRFAPHLVAEQPTLHLNDGEHILRHDWNRPQIATPFILVAVRRVVAPQLGSVRRTEHVAVHLVRIEAGGSKVAASANGVAHANDELLSLWDHHPRLRRQIPVDAAAFLQELGDGAAGSIRFAVEHETQAVPVGFVCNRLIPASQNNRPLLLGNKELPCFQPVHGETQRLTQLGSADCDLHGN